MALSSPASSRAPCPLARPSGVWPESTPRPNQMQNEARTPRTGHCSVGLCLQWRTCVSQGIYFEAKTGAGAAQKAWLGCWECRGSAPELGAWQMDTLSRGQGGHCTCCPRCSPTPAGAEAALTGTGTRWQKQERMAVFTIPWLLAQFLAPSLLALAICFHVMGSPASSKLSKGAFHWPVGPESSLPKGCSCKSPDLTSV